MIASQGSGTGGGRTPPQPPARPPAPALAAGSVSLRLYPYEGLGAAEVLEALAADARMGVVSGFDGVMASEHHGGFAGYLPNPVQLCGWLLHEMPRGWAAPCPLLLPLRPLAVVAEDLAWLSARFPGRVGAGVAAGSLARDFEITGTSTHALAERFAEDLNRLAALMSGREAASLAGDRAVARCAEHPVPLVSAAMSQVAARRAAGAGVGLLFDSLSTPARVSRLVQVYREAGGPGPAILIRRAWVGPPPAAVMDRQVEVYRSYASTGATAHWGSQELVCGEDAAAVHEQLSDLLAATGVDALNLRVHVPGVEPDAARHQIRALGEVAVALRSSGAFHGRRGSR